MKLAVVTLILLGCLAAGAAVIVVNLFIETRAEQEVEVLVAAEDLTPLSKIEASHVKQVPVAKAAVLQERGYLVDPIQAIGRVLSGRIAKGQLLTTSCFLSEKEAELFSTEIPEGMRAFTLALPGSSVMSGLLYPYCRVDIYGIFRLKDRSEGDARGREILQAVEVLAVEYNTVVSEGNDAKQGRSTHSSSVRVTFALTPDEVKALQLSRNEGDIYVALRNPQDPEIRQPTDLYIAQGTIRGPVSKRVSFLDSDPNDVFHVAVGEDSIVTLHAIHVIEGSESTIISVRGDSKDLNATKDDASDLEPASNQSLAAR